MKRPKWFVAVVVLVFASLELFAADPAAELARGRAALNKRDYASAAQILSDAVPSAEMILSEDERKQALAALHFYAALAYHNVPDLDQTKEHLKAFFELQPNARIDPKTYGQPFTTVFNQVRTTPTTSSSVSFESLYPNWDTVSAKTPEPFVGFVGSPEYQYLATQDEKRGWDDSWEESKRGAWIDAFWKRRDPTPADDRNEFREQFLARVAFADYYFSSADVRGSLTDRGRVFLLLGKPGAIENRRFRPSDGELSLQGEYEYGEATLEIWKYPRKMLPVAVPTAGVSYMFVTHKHLGDHMLFDLKGMPLQALLGAADKPLKQARK